MNDNHEVMRGHVVFRKQVNDGSYGSESAEVMLDVPLDTIGVPVGDYIAATLEHARRLVHAELAKSPAPRVRDAVTPPSEDSRGAEPEDLEDLPY